MTKYLWVLFCVIGVILLPSAAQAGSPTEVGGATTVDAATAKSLFDRGVPFVDVRGNSYYDGHIPGAVHLNRIGAFKESKFAKVAKKDQEVVIYCGGFT